MAASASTIRVKGWRETMLAFKLLEKGLPLEMKAEAKHAAEPVAEEARARIGRYRGASTSTIKPYASSKGAVVRQSQSKKTGLRGDFGAIQMRHLFWALEEHAPEVERRFEQALDRLTREAGF